MGQNPSPENMAEHKKLKEEFIKIKASKLQHSLHEMNSSFSLESSTGTFLHLTKALYEDIWTKREATVL